MAISLNVNSYLTNSQTKKSKETTEIKVNLLCLIYHTHPHIILDFFDKLRRMSEFEAYTGKNVTKNHKQILKLMPLGRAGDDSH